MLPDGFRIYPSSYEPKLTMDRLVAAVIDHGMAIVARIDHASAATKVGLELRPTEVLLFGNPLVGTQLMQVSKTTGIDLPLKALVWQDQEGRTWLGTTILDGSPRGMGSRQERNKPLRPWQTCLLPSHMWLSTRNREQRRE